MPVARHCCLYSKVIRLYLLTISVLGGMDVMVDVTTGSSGKAITEASFGMNAVTQVSPNVPCLILKGRFSLGLEE